ncbi:unnamed protein product [Malus baccata var. baccata]
MILIPVVAFCFLCLIYRDITMEYSDHVHKLGLKSDHLLSLDCAKGHLILTHYYLPCPEPELTMALQNSHHTLFDTCNMLYNYICQTICCWIPINYFIVFLQLISNDRFKSVEHQVLANYEGPRVSIACFFTLHLYPSTKLYDPIKNLLSEDHPPVYMETSLQDFISYYDGKGLDGNFARTHFKWQR